MEKYCIEFINVKEEPEDLLHEDVANFCPSDIKEESGCWDEPSNEVDLKDFSSQFAYVTPEVICR